MLEMRMGRRGEGGKQSVEKGWEVERSKRERIK